MELAREIWKEFGLNNSMGAGMTQTDLGTGKVINKHGQQLNTDGFNVMPDLITHYRTPVEVEVKLKGKRK